MRIIPFLLLCLIVACKPQPRKEPDPAKTPNLADVVNVYTTLQSAATDSRGWSDTDRCDALLWASLRAASGADVDVEIAEDDGRWYRRPINLPECFSTGESASTISRDMLIGVLWWAWSTNRPDVVERLWSYGQSRNWVMGDDHNGGVSTVLNPNMISLTAQLCKKLGGSCQNADTWASVPLTYTDPSPRGYERHLEALQMLLLGEMTGSLPGYLVDRLIRHSNEQLSNPLYMAAMVLYMGRPVEDVETIVISRWPADRLPMSSDWCSAWVTETEQGESGSLPCNDGKIHTGGEILFINRLLHGR